MDNLSKCMIQCKKDGFGVHYGAWRATQENVPILKDETVIPEKWLRCAHCGKPFKPVNRLQKYCDAVCQREAQYERKKQRKKEGVKNEI